VFIVITAILYITIGFVELPLMLESPVMWAATVGVFPSTTVPPATQQRAFFTNTQPATPGLTCSCPGCLSVNTYLPIFNVLVPNQDPTPGTTVTTCYFDHPDVMYSGATGLGPFDVKNTPAGITTGATRDRISAHTNVSHVTRTNTSHATQVVRLPPVPSQPVTPTFQCSGMCCQSYCSAACAR